LQLFDVVEQGILPQRKFCVAVVFTLFLSCHCRIMHKEGCERELHVMVTRLSTAGDGFENGVHIVGIQGKPTKSILVEK